MTRRMTRARGDPRRATVGARRAMGRRARGCGRARAVRRRLEMISRDTFARSWIFEGTRRRTRRRRRRRLKKIYRARGRRFDGFWIYRIQIREIGCR